MSRNIHNLIFKKAKLKKEGELIDHESEVCL